jgi:CheY-like chemotaxis protein
MELTVPTKMKVVCPKCKAKLTFDADKITSAVLKCKCPGCASVLHIKKPVPPKGKPPEPSSPKKQLRKTGRSIRNPGEETMDLAGKLEREMGFASPEEKAEPPGFQQQAESGATGRKKPSGLQGNGKDAVKKQEKEGAGAGKSREFKRVKFKKKVLVNNQIMVEALDISENGLFLHTGRSFEDGAIVEVGIPTLPGNFDLKVSARVKHNHRGIGMGLQFVALDEKQLAMLKKLISELDEAAAQELEGRKKILLVGGTDTARNINKSKLVLDGFYVLQATTPDEVFHILDNDPPDAMTLEWQEPAFNCKELLAQIKQNSQYDPVVRVVLSTLTDISVQRTIIDAGAHRCMAKMDTNPARLSIVLKQLIEERDS